MPSTSTRRPKTAVLQGKDTATALASQAASLLKVVSDPTRLEILLALTDGKLSTSQICERLGQSQPALSHHLALLKVFEMVDTNRESSETHYELTVPGARLIEFTQGLFVKDGHKPQPVLTEAEWKKLIKKVGSVVDDPEDWLNRPNPRFEGRRPIDLMGTPEAKRVHNLIEAAQQGFFS